MRIGKHAAFLVGSARQAHWGSRHAVRLSLCGCAALMAALMSLGLALPGISAGRPAQAASTRPNALICSGPCVGIITPTFNNVAEGPVGAHLTVEGANWSANATLTIWPALTQAACAQTPPSAITGSLMIDATGSASGSYVWPLSVNAVGQSYVLCGSDGTLTIMPGVTVNAPNTYTVLAANPPAITLTPPKITQGDMFTISGQNWKPAQPVTVNICSDAACNTQALPSQRVTSNDDGTLEIQFPTSSNTPAGTYYVQATSDNGALTAPPVNAPVQLTVNALPTPTPSPSPKPTVTPTPTPSPAPSSRGTGDTALLIFMLGTLSILFLIGGIISLAVYTRAGP